MSNFITKEDNQLSKTIESSFLKVVMKKMTIRLTIIILLISTASYFYFEKNVKKQLRDQIKTYTDTKAKNETLFYGTLEDDLALIINNFQKKNKLKNEFSKLEDLGDVELRQDGSIRNKPENYKADKDVAVFIPEQIDLTNYHIRHLALAKESIKDYIPFFDKSFAQVWFASHEKGSVSFSLDNAKQTFSLPANFDDTQEIYYRISENDLNPDRKMVWSKPYYEQNLKTWMISLVAPVYDNEIQIGSFGIDFYMREINSRIRFNSNIGIMASIIDEGGNIIDHPLYNKYIYNNNGNFTVQESKDRTLNEIYTKISLASPSEKTLILETEQNKKIVGVARIPNTPWFIITEQNTEHYANSLFDHLRFSILISIISLILEIIIIYRTLNKHAIAPIHHLVNEIDNNIKSNFSTNLTSNRNDELGEMSKSYNQLIAEIKKKEELITKYQNILEERVSKRTMQLNSALKHADEANTKAVYTEKMASLGEMASGIAHEINNPLQIIQLSLSTLEKMSHKEIDYEKALKTVKKIDSTADRILEIIRGLDQFSNEKNVLPLIQKNLNELVQQAAEHMISKLKESEVIIDISIDSQLSIYCLQTQIIQVFTNLIQNSIDALEQFPSDQKWIKVWAEQNAITTFVYFQDSGQGIPPEVHQKIMTPFFTTKEIGKGTGLGLSIIKGIMSKHLGSVHYDTQAKNTTFVLKFPRRIQP